jgi:hypothetical protein
MSTIPALLQHHWPQDLSLIIVSSHDRSSTGVTHQQPARSLAISAMYTMVWLPMRSLKPEQQQSSRSLPNPITYRDGRPTPALRQGMQPNPPQLLAPPVCMQHQKANRHCTIAAESLHSACLPSTYTSLPAHYHSETNSCCNCSCCSCTTKQTTRHSQPVTAAAAAAAAAQTRPPGTVSQSPLL